MGVRSAALVVALVGATTPMLLGPPSAAATDVCVGHGTMTTGPLVYPVTASLLPSVTVHQPRTVGFAFSLPFGQCAGTSPIKQLQGTGTLTGWCGHLSGQGVANGGKTFALAGAGTALTLTGHITGVLTMVPNPLSGQSCLTGARDFIVTGAAVLLHCAILQTALVTVDPGSSLTSPASSLSIHRGPMPYHKAACVPAKLNPAH